MIYGIFLTVEDTKNTGLKLIKELNKTQFSLITKKLDAINDIVTDMNRLDSFIKYYNELMIQFNSVRSDDIESILNINNLISSYLSAFKKFTDNWQTAITHKYGKQSAELNLFKKAR